MSLILANTRFDNSCQWRMLNFLRDPRYFCIAVCYGKRENRIPAVATVALLFARLRFQERNFQRCWNIRPGTGSVNFARASSLFHLFPYRATCTHASACRVCFIVERLRTWLVSVIKPIVCEVKLYDTRPEAKWIVKNKLSAAACCDDRRCLSDEDDNFALESSSFRVLFQCIESENQPIFSCTLMQYVPCSSRSFRWKPSFRELYACLLKRVWKIPSTRFAIWIRLQ